MGIKKPKIACDYMHITGNLKKLHENDMKNGGHSHNFHVMLDGCWEQQ